MAADPPAGGVAAEVVIIGGGFAGLSAARGLTEHLDARRVRITLVDEHVYSTFQPLLYQVATGGLNPGDVAYPIRSFTRRRGIRFHRGRVLSLRPDERRVVLADGTKLSFDYLVIAVGADVNYFGVPGAAEYAHALYTRAEAISLRDLLLGGLEAAAEGGASLSMVVVGGGATGVETAGTLAELRAALPATFPEIDTAAVRIVLVEQANELLGPFAPVLRAYARRELERRGVEIRIGTGITEVGRDYVRLSDGSTIPSELTVWAAGIGIDRDVSSWGLPQGRGGRLVVGSDLRIDGQERIFAAGDVALDLSQPLAQLAQPAIQTGLHAGRQVTRLLADQPTEPFSYRDKGTMATIGRRAAVVEFPSGWTLRGTLAWFAWLGLHIVSLLGNRNRASALLNLSTRYVSWPSGLIVGDIPDKAET